MYPHWDKVPEKMTDWFEALVNLTQYLRGPDGCPWDQEHTGLEFTRDLEGEVSELAEAMASGNNDHAEEEFGDVFFILLAVAAAAEHEGRFNLHDALKRAHEKMIRRHDHVFGENRATTPEEAMESWHRMKREEKR
jgi:uncharacterized protein YabN with tetrapyrrole methylase and pyrophosphatase domain